MKRERKQYQGFTLIEVLAVVIILSILAVICIPLIIGIIERIKDEAFRVSVRNIFTAVELEMKMSNDLENGLVTSLEMKNGKFDGGLWEYYIDDDSIVLTTVHSSERYVCRLTDKEKNTKFEISKRCDGFIVVTDPEPGVMEGSGTEEDPFMINSIEDLVAFSKSVDDGNDYKEQYIKLGLSLDFNWNYSYVDYNTIMFGDVNNDGYIAGLKTELTSGMGFNPIGGRVDGTYENDKHFSGIFIGNNKEISGLYIYNESTGVNGLFGSIDGATITDLSITNVNITTYSYTGILAGRAYYDEVFSSQSNLSNIHTQGSIKSKSGVIGGIIGRGYGTIVDSSSEVNIEVSNSSSSIGGLAGDYYEGSINNNHTMGTIEKKHTTDTYSQTGGLVGIVRGTTTNITNNSSSAVINSRSGNHVGGLIGYSYSNIAFSNSSGAVTGENGTNIGGLIGYISGSVTDSYATGNVQANGSYQVGGLIGQASSSTINSYATGEVINLSAEQTYSRTGGLIGYIANSTSPVTNCYATGSVTSESGTNVGGLVGRTLSLIESSWATGNVTSNHTIAESVGVGGLVGYTSGGVLDSYAEGNVVTKTGHNIAGLVGFTNNFIRNSYATGDAETKGESQTYSQTAGLVGYVSSSDVVISNCYATGKVTSRSGKYIGGLVGYTNSLIENSHAMGNVYSNEETTESIVIGGLVGYASGGIIDSYAEGNVISKSGYNVGGLAGYSTNFIQNSHAIGDVTMQGEDQLYSRIGGLVGYAGSGEFTIDNSYATGKVTSRSGKYIGGLVGYTTMPIQNSWSSSIMTSNQPNYDSIVIGGLAGYSSGGVTDSYASGSVNVDTGYNIGGLIGYTNNSIINSHATGEVQVSGEGQSNCTAGGLVGYSTNTESTIKNSYATGNVSCKTGGFIGGLAGYSVAHIENTYSSGNVNLEKGYSHGTDVSYVEDPENGIVNVTGDFIGGLVGRTNGNSIIDSYTTGHVISSSGVMVGGIVGGASGGNIKNSYSLGTVTGRTNVGGIGGFISSNGPVEIINSYAIGNINSSEAGIGGLIGFNSGVNVKNSYATGNITSTGESTHASNNCVGGLFGCVQSSMDLIGQTSFISNVYYVGNVSGIRNVGGITGQIGIGKSNVTIENLYVSANINASQSSVAGIVPFTNRTVGATDGVITINKLFVAGHIESLSSVYPLTDKASATYLTTDNLYRSSTLQVINQTSPVSSYGTEVNVNDLKTSTWYTNTLGFDNNWKFQNDNYPLLYNINDSGVPTMNLLNHQVNKLVQ
jgi:prepilin-type N-terminal cleavage/methylation domain-containing protein